MSTEKQVHDNVAKLLGQLRRAYAADETLTALVALAEAITGCLAQRQRFSQTFNTATRLPGVRLEGVDRPEPAVAAIAIIRDSASVLAQSLQTTTRMQHANGELQELQQQADHLAQRLAMVVHAGVESTRRSLGDVEQAQQELAAVITQYRTLRDEFGVQSSDYGGHAAKLEAELDQERIRLEHLADQQAKLDKRREEVLQMLAKREALNKDCEEAERHLQKLKDKRPDVEHQIEQVKLEGMEAEKQVAALNAELEKVKEDSSTQLKERDRLRNELNEAKQIATVIKKLRAEIETLEQNRQQDEEQVEDLKKRQVELRTRAAAMREQLAATRVLVKAADQWDDTGTASQIQQLWTKLPADALDKRLKELLE